ncbi:methylated-DNA--[protein]-cysteine S-methyltransferase [Candidatus Gracilibacteria bacterium]|nr:methylated-DNA--[protein]-cysteine S-methyltransferase [Candidatus Gracilibacteria bacterium]
MEIHYGIHRSPFGWCLVGISQNKVCHFSFIENNDTKNRKLIEQLWPEALLISDQRHTAPYVKKIFTLKNTKAGSSITLLLKGTDFQIKVWQALLKIPRGATTTYAQIAQDIGSPKAARAVGTACGKNTIGVVIPCHRVMSSDGTLGGYRWGIKRKAAILDWEQS